MSKIVLWGFSIHETYKDGGVVMEWFKKEAGPKQGRKTRQMERKPLKLVCKKKKKRRRVIYAHL